MMFTQEEIEEARRWFNDCQWLDLIDFDDLSIEEIERGINKHYDGGIEQFKRDCL